MADAKNTDSKKTEIAAEIVTAGGAASAQKISEKAAVAVRPPEAAAPAKVDLNALAGFKLKSIVTRPVLRLEDHQPVAFKVEEGFFEGKALEGSKMAPATLLHVYDLLGHRSAVIVSPAVLQAEIEEKYPDKSYVGKYFGVEKLPKREGKRYNDYNIVELEPA